jgi:transposase
MSTGSLFIASFPALDIPVEVVPLRCFARMLRRHAEGILNGYFFPISTAKVEGINNQVKAIKRKAFGYRDLNDFELKIYNIHTLRYPFV